MSGKLILGSSNQDYHADNTHLSSSALKLLLKSAADFEHQYVLGNRSSETKDAFTEGSLVHCLILEPHKLDEYAVFPGMRRAGTLYETFKRVHSDKIIVSSAQMLRCEKLVRAYQSLPVALELMANTLPEYNMVSDILGVPVKARADAINVSDAVIIDVKTTSMPSGAEVFRQTVNEYMYQLSAALYCQIAFNNTGKLHDFYWLVLSKADGQCHIYKASSDTLSQGAALVTQSLVKYKKCKETGIWADGHIGPAFDTADYEIIEI